MRAWPAPELPELGVRGPEVSLWSSSARGVVPVVPNNPDRVARLYVCGITPYDATHMGHAATYIAFDLLNRAWRSAGHSVRFVQNVTDVDDPLLERANQTGEEWTELAGREIELFRSDMTALRVLPPDAYIGAVESIPLVIEMVAELHAHGATYAVDNDIYFSVSADRSFGTVSGTDRAEMLELFAERGGDPDRPGKKDPLDCLLWQGERPNEPAWDSPLGPGRPGWHIECAAIARAHLGDQVDVVGGGRDLVFPHHEMGASEVRVATDEPFAQAYVHAGMVGLDGEKMSKSKGNLVLVSTLLAEGVDPMAIRLAVLNHHYRSDWEWTREGLTEAEATLSVWRRALSEDSGAPTTPVVKEVFTALADDLDAPRAVGLINGWASATLSLRELGSTGVQSGASAVIRDLVDTTLGLHL